VETDHVAKMRGRRVEAIHFEEAGSIRNGFLLVRLADALEYGARGLR
jgi:hypothetical protein